jgi:hypothetical protein
VQAVGTFGVENEIQFVLIFVDPPKYLLAPGMGGASIDDF